MSLGEQKEDEGDEDEKEEVTLEKVDTASFSIDMHPNKSKEDDFDALMDSK